VITEIRTAVYKLLLECPDLTALNVFWGYAPEGAEFPFIVINPAGFTVARDTTPQSFENITYLFAIRGKNQIELEKLRECIVLYFDNGEPRLNLYLQNYRALAILREYEGLIIEPDEVLNQLLRYTIKVTK
jgi:hypothetical protein